MPVCLGAHIHTLVVVYIPTILIVGIWPHLACRGNDHGCMYRNATLCLLHIMCLHIQSMTLSIIYIYIPIVSLSSIYIHESSTPFVCYSHHIYLLHPYIPLPQHVPSCFSHCTPSMICFYDIHEAQPKESKSKWSPQAIMNKYEQVLVPLTSEESH